MSTTRRGFLGIMLGACVAPSIVRADSLMRIFPRDQRLALSSNFNPETWVQLPPKLHIIQANVHINLDDLWKDEEAFGDQVKLIFDPIHKKINQPSFMRQVINDRKREKISLELLAVQERYLMENIKG